MSGHYNTPSEYGDPPLTEQEVNALRAGALGHDSLQPAALQLHNVEQQEDDEQAQQQTILRSNRLNAPGAALYHHQANHCVHNNFFIRQNPHLAAHLGPSPADVHAAALEADQERASGNNPFRRPLRLLHSADYLSNMMDIEDHNQTAAHDLALINVGVVGHTDPTGFNAYDHNQPDSRSLNDFGLNGFAVPHPSNGEDYGQVAPPDPNSSYAGVFDQMAPPDPCYAHASTYGQPVAAPAANATNCGGQYAAAPEGRNPFTGGTNGQIAPNFPCVSGGHVLRPRLRPAPATGPLAQPMSLDNPNNGVFVPKKKAAPRKPPPPAAAAAAKETKTSGKKARDQWTNRELAAPAQIRREDITDEYIEKLGAHTFRSARDMWRYLNRERRGKLSAAEKATKARRLLADAAKKAKQDKMNKKNQENK